jgi:outer membrane receptor protein involved in Fe transport
LKETFVKRNNRAIVPTKIAIATSLAIMQMGAAWAQNASAESAGSGLNLDEMVITATPEARSKMKQSLSVSSMDGDQIRDSMPTSSAEILRSIPGVRSEASSGEGNANVTVRGLPISAGGSRYVQFQEDGLPVLLMGDYNFITPDMFMRADAGTDGVEVVRGGSASTMATNAPGGVINFLSKTGETEGGTVGITTNVGGASSKRIDFGYGKHLSDTSRFQISAFARGGEGTRATQGVEMEGGGMVRVALSKDFGGGNNAKVYAKFLDDKTPIIMDSPVRIVNGQIVALDGVDPRTFTPYANGLPSIPKFGLFGPGGNMNDGLQSKSTAAGAEVNLDLGGGWKVNEKFRLSSNSGSFNGIMPADYNPGGLGNPVSNNPGGYTALFLGARFNDAGLAVNDIKASKTHAMADQQKLTTTVGLFTASQKLNLDWEIGGFSSTLPVNGATTYGPYTSWYKKSVNVTYDSIAPYGALAYESGPLNLDASIRLDRQQVRGTFQDNGTKLPSGADLGAQGVNYSSSLNSYSLGANYSVTKDTAVFARVSGGGSLQSDRILASSGATAAACGTSCWSGPSQTPNKVTQYETGVKWRSGNVSTFVTFFNAKTDESNYDLTTGVSSANKYDAKGVEIEASYKSGGFRLNGGLTLTDAKVVDSNNAAYIGATPNRQATTIFQITPSYRFGGTTLGASVIGTSASEDAQTSKYQATLPAYTYVNAFVKHDINTATTVMLGVNNLFDVTGYTEVNSDRAAARSITGRTVRLSLNYNF